MKNRAILALALCAFGVMPAQAMNNDTYTAAIDARDANRVYALLIAGKPIPAGVISDFYNTKEIIDKNLERNKNSTYVTRDEIEFQSEKSDRLNEIANVFCAFIERGNLKKPATVSRREWAHFKETVGVFDAFGDDDKGKITAPTYAAFKAEEDREMEDLIPGNKKAKPTVSNQQRTIHELLNMSNKYDEERGEAAFKARMDALPKLDDILKRLELDQQKKEAQKSNTNNQFKKYGHDEFD